MRKAIFALLLAGSAGMKATAQKGTILLTGSVFASSQRSESSLGDQKTSYWGILPGIGYGITDKWTLGVKGGYSRYKAAPDSKAYSLGPLVRYTHPLSEIFSVFGQLESGYSFRKYSSQVQDREFYLTLAPAVEMNLPNRFALNFSVGGLGYRSTRPKDSEHTSRRFDLDFGSGAVISVTKRFGGKK